MSESGILVRLAAPASPRPGPSGRSLAAIVAIVLVAHYWVLDGQLAALGQDPLAPGPLFQTRTVAAQVKAAANAPTKPPAPATPVAAKPPSAAKPGDAAEANPTVAPATAPETGAQTGAQARPEARPESAAEPSAATPTASPPAAAVPEASAAQTSPPGAEPLPVQTLAVSVPANTTLRYATEAKRGFLSLSGEGELRWQHDGQHYQARLNLSVTGVRAEYTSAGRITPAGLAPERFADKSRGERAAHFRPELGLISFSANTPDAPLVPGAQDQVSALLQLAGLLAAAHTPLAQGQLFSFQLVSAREAVPYSFQVMGNETLKLPQGALEVVKLLRVPRADRAHERKIELWFAPALNWLPARIRYTEANGTVIEAQLSAPG